MKFSKGSAEGHTLTFPLTELPQEPCALHSPKVGIDHGLDAPPAGDDETAELMDVFQVRHQVAAGLWPKEYMEKHDLGWKFYKDGEVITNAAPMYGPTVILKQFADIHTPVQAAKAVHMDDPVDLGLFIFKYLMREGAEKARYGRSAC